jgi:hypothetical protein
LATLDSARKHLDLDMSSVEELKSKFRAAHAASFDDSISLEEKVASRAQQQELFRSLLQAGWAANALLPAQRKWSSRRFPSCLLAWVQTLW